MATKKPEQKLAAVKFAEQSITYLLEDLERETGRQVAFVEIDAGNFSVEITMLDAK